MHPPCPLSSLQTPFSCVLSHQLCEATYKGECKDSKGIGFVFTQDWLSVCDSGWLKAYFHKDGCLSISACVQMSEV